MAWRLGLLKEVAHERRAELELAIKKYPKEEKPAPQRDQLNMTACDIGSFMTRIGFWETCLYPLYFFSDKKPCGRILVIMYASI